MNQPARAVTSQVIFCRHCVAESTDQTPGDVSTMNGVGRKFYGSAAPCPECASVIRTLWWTFASIPIVPLASYRYKTASTSFRRARFWCRQLPSTKWDQVMKTWAVGIPLAAAVVGVFYHWKIWEKTLILR